MLALRRMVLPFLVVAAALVGTSGPAAAAPAPPGQADLGVAFTATYPSAGFAFPSQYFNLVTVTNTGPVTSGPAVLRLAGLGFDLALPTGGTSYYGAYEPEVRVDLPALAPGASTEVTFDAQFTVNAFGPAAIAAVVEPVLDPNPFNNIAFRGFLLDTVVF